MPSYYREGLGWTLLELTDALRALKKVHSRTAGLITLHVHAASFQPRFPTYSIKLHGLMFIQ